MALFVCPICFEEGHPNKACPKCKHVEKRFKELENRMHKAESFSYWLEQTFDTLFREVSADIAAGKDIIPVPRQLLENVLNACHKGAKLERKTDLILIGMIVCDAVDTLKARGTKLEPKVRGMLKKHLTEYFKFHGWDDEKLEPGERISRNVWDADPIY